MSNTRFFDGSRTSSGAAGQAMKQRLMKKGAPQVSSKDRYKQAMQKKLADHKRQAELNPRNFFALPGAESPTHQRSKKAEAALKEMAMKKAAKEEKKNRQMVVVQARNFSGVGHVDTKGRVYDYNNQQVLKIDTKTGKIKSYNGAHIGKYKPKSWMTNQLLIDSIKKYSPYFIRMRQMQALLQQQQLAQYYAGMNGQTGPTLYGPGTMPSNNLYGYVDQPDQLDAFQRVATVNAWGVTSNNVHGTFADNVHGTMADNVWGTAYSNVWGGVGGPGMWGKPGKTLRIWGTGSGKNYLAPLFGRIGMMLGLSRGRSGGQGRTSGRTGGGRR